MRCVSILLASVLAASLAHPADRSSGVIKGTVFDETGKAVPLARIRLLRLSPSQVLKRYDRADGHGSFAIDGLAWGGYMLCASKEEDGYADNLLDLYATGQRPTAVITPASPTQSVIVRIGPRAGILLLQPVVDAVTGKALPSVSVTIRRYDNGAMMRIGYQPEVLLPPLTKISIEVAADGYLDWFYPGSLERGKAEVVLLRPEEKLAITVALQPMR